MSKSCIALITFLSVLLSPLAPASVANAGGGGLDIKDVNTGSLITGSFGPAIYYYAYDGKRYVFPNEKVYFSWFKDFTGVKRVGNESLATVSIGGNVTYKPGVRLVKVQTDPKVYAVANGKLLRWVTTETLARELYGADWATKIHDVPDAFFVDYEIGRPITSAEDYDPDWDIYANQSISSYSSMLNDPSELPEDVPIYADGSVTSVSVYGDDDGQGSVFIRSDADAASVIAWYKDHAPRDGWELMEKTLSEKRAEELGFSKMVRFRKQTDGVTYELSVSRTEYQIYVTRAIPPPDPDVSVLPSFVPVYNKGEMVLAGELDEGILGYMALSEERANDLFAYMAGRLQSESWREIDHADADRGILRLYDRPLGGELKNLILIIFNMPNEQDVVYVMVAYGSSERLSESIPFQEVAKTLEELNDSSDG